MKNSNGGIRPLSLRAGDLVEVRTESEILATLDVNGAVDGLPFMPEMLEFCGKRFRVESRADKTCDTINYSGSRRMYATVHLGGLRCNGSAHGGCQAGCLFFWKEAWLKSVPKNEAGAARSGFDRQTQSGAASERSCTREMLFKAVRQDAPDEAEPRYRCQATDLLKASEPLAWWDVRQYVRDVRSGNVSVADVVRAALFRIFLRLLKLGGYRALLASYNRLQSWRGGTPFPYFSGTLDKPPRATLDLRPGELVRVKSKAEILQTLNKRNRNFGLSFDPEMVRYCGGVHRVRARAERIIDERNGKMVHLSRDCIILDNVVCRAQYSPGRLFCPRALYPFWREIWLQRMSAPDSGATSPTARAAHDGDPGSV